MSPKHFEQIRRVRRRGFDSARDAIRELQWKKRCKARLNANGDRNAQLDL